MSVADKLAMQPYLLSADGCIHSSDVRSVCVTGDGTLLTASRDNTAQMTALPTDGDEITVGLSFVGHQAFVNFVTLHPGIAVLDGEPCVVTGSNDKHVALWSLESSALEAVLDGHAHGVCCGVVLTEMPLASAETSSEWTGDLVTGDWGGMCIVFDHQTGRTKQVYDKHKTAVRGVAHLPHTQLVLSCSGDKTVHAWDVTTGVTAHIFTGHDDVVQCICAVNSKIFVTGSNDCTIRVWSIGIGTAQQVLYGHDSLVFSVAWNPATKELLSASEDHTVKVWSCPEALLNEEAADSTDAPWQLIQSMSHPCVVWSAAAHPATGDVVTGGSDGVVRLWTRNAERAASPEKLVALDDAVARQTVDVKVAQQSDGGLDVRSMPSVDEIHLRQGRHAGERLFARGEAGAVEMFVWGAGRWDKVGVVVAGPDQQQYTGAPLPREKRYHDGKAYDYLFDVDVEGRMLKLPYNVGQSVFEAAQDFITSHAGVVTQDSKEEIQNFILQNIRPEDVRQIPGLEGGGPANAAASNGSGGAAPAMSSAASPASPTVDESPVHPWSTCQTFTSINEAAVQKKITELTSPDETFSHVVQSTTAADQTDGGAALIDAFKSLFDVLPPGSRFPCLDLLRVAVCRPHAAAARVPRVLLALAPLQSSIQLEGDAEVLVALRLAANLVAAVVETPQALSGLSVDAKEVLLWLAFSFPLMHSRSTNPHIITALLAVVRNAALLVVRWPASVQETTVGRLQFAEGVVAIAARVLLYTPSGAKQIPSVLSSLFTLYSPPALGNEEWLPQIIERGAGMLCYSLQALRDGADPLCRTPAAQLLSQLTKSEQ